MMVRKRVHNASDSSSVAANIRQERKHPKSDAYSWTRSKLFIAGIIILLMLGIAVYIHNTYRIYIENLVVTKSDLSLASQADAYDPFVWGTYRSHLYFGLRNRHPQSPLFGLLWYKQPREREIRSLPLRHWCDQGDNLKYMWHDADGKTFGHQTIEDGRLKFNTDWFNQHHSWSARIDVKSLPPNTSYAFVFYLAVQDQNTDLELVQKINKGHYVLLQGFSPLFDDFELSLQTNRAFPAISYTTHKANQLLDMTQVNNLILSSLGRQENGDLVLVPRDESASSPNFVAVQLNINEPISTTITYSTMKGAVPPFDSEYDTRLSSFRAKFKKAFPINVPEDSEFLETMGKSALSNMLGSIGYWHGHSIVKSDSFRSADPKYYGPLNLLATVPSRPFFPRGFLWDEGFHNLLIRQFDPLLSIDILSSWLDLMNMNGWIPREMILGNEALAKVPPEFVVQHDSVANPPMFFYLIQKFMNTPDFMVKHASRLCKLYPRLKLWYIWLKNSQMGPKHGSFQWQGRNSTTDLELNSKTLPSGMDDFPRATHPNRDEYHLDLRVWMAMASKTLRRLSENCEDMSWIAVVEEDIRVFNDLESLDRLHWSESAKRYCDYGLHSETVRLMPVQKSPQEVVYVRKVLSPPKLGLVENVNGYLNLFPFLLKLLPPDYPNLAIILNNLNKTEELWTPFGLRSLSTKSPYYLARNTEHDAPYWRGPIWINMNYLALDALNHYSRQSGPNAQFAVELYAELKKNVISNIDAQYKKTGLFWENYDDRTGEGKGTRPFTGWTALVLNILADNYD